MGERASEGGVEVLWEVVQDEPLDTHALSPSSFPPLSYIWNVLLNFGGTVGMRGNAATVMTRPYEYPPPGFSQVGVGITGEAINQNPVMFELALDHAWNSAPRAMDTWLHDWVRARYGYAPDVAGALLLVASEDMYTAWTLLLGSAYSVYDRAQGNGYWGTTKSVIEKRPSLSRGSVISGGFQGSELKYEACDLVAAWRLLVGAVPREDETAAALLVLRGGALELDLVDVTRQALSDMAQVLYSRWLAAVQHRDIATATLQRDRFLNLLLDIDVLLTSLPHFDFATWMNAAEHLAVQNAGSTASDDTRGGAAAEEERKLYAYNARNLVTRWGPNGEINDYASRLWGGLIRSYYFPRWKLAMDAVLAEMRRDPNEVPSDDVFLGNMQTLEEQWQNRGFDGEGSGAGIAAAGANTPLASVQNAFEKYGSTARVLCKEAV